MVNATISGVKSSITLIWVLFLFVYFIFMASRLSDMFSSLSFLKQPASMSERLDYLPLKQGVACSILSRMLIFLLLLLLFLFQLFLITFSVQYSERNQPGSYLVPYITRLRIVASYCNLSLSSVDVFTEKGSSYAVYPFKFGSAEETAMSKKNKSPLNGI